MQSAEKRKARALPKIGTPGPIVIGSQFDGDFAAVVVDGLTLGDLSVAHDGRAEGPGTFAGRIGSLAAADLQCRGLPGYLWKSVVERPKRQ